MTFKIAVIGCGWVSTACHAPAYLEYARAHPDVQLAACCDVDPQRAEQFRAQFGFQRAYTHYKELLDREQPQAVALNVPPNALSAIGCDVLTRGFPLHSEKPPGLTLPELDRLIAAARASGVIHQVAFNRRFMPLMLELKQQLAGLAIFHLDMQLARVRRADPNFATTAVHAIDAARFLIGSDYAHARIHYQELPHLGPGVANYTLDCQFVPGVGDSSGASAHLSIFPVTGLNIERATLYALDHTFHLHANNGPDAPGRLAHYHQGRLISTLSAAELTGRREDYYLNGFYHEDAAFFDSVRAGRQPSHDFQSCRQSIEMMQCLTERKTSFPYPTGQGLSE